MYKDDPESGQQPPHPRLPDQGIAVTEINHAVYQNASRPATPEELKHLKAELFNTWDKYSVRPRRNR